MSEDRCSSKATSTCDILKQWRYILKSRKIEEMYLASFSLSIQAKFIMWPSVMSTTASLFSTSILSSLFWSCHSIFRVEEKIFITMSEQMIEDQQVNKINLLSSTLISFRITRISKPLKFHSMWHNVMVILSIHTYQIG